METREIDPKEQLIKKFNKEFFDEFHSEQFALRVLDFFYSEIEKFSHAVRFEREELSKRVEAHDLCLKELSSLREQLKAADEVIEFSKIGDNTITYHEALEKYQQLKEKI